MFDFNSFIRMVRIHTFWVVWIEDLGPTVELSFFAIARVAQDLVTFYMTFCWDIDPPCIFVAMIIVENGSTLFICGHGPFRFDMAHFCILSDHDSFISYTYVGSACIFMAMLCIWTCMYQRSVFLTFISLSGIFTRAFWSWILCSLHTQFFLYNVFRLSSSPLTSHIRGHLL